MTSETSTNASTTFETTSKQDLKMNDNSTLYHAAQILKSSIKNSSQSIRIQPLEIEDLNIDRIKSLIPTDLYNFLCLVINPNKVDSSSPVANSIADERHILAIAQDLIHASSHGRVKTPKHVGLAMSIRHMTGSKQLITMLNRLGHCSSYDEIEIIDTSLTL